MKLMTHMYDANSVVFVSFVYSFICLFFVFIYLLTYLLQTCFFWNFGLNPPNASGK